MSSFTGFVPLSVCTVWVSVFIRVSVRNQITWTVCNSFLALRFARRFVQKRRPGSCQVFIDINIRHCFSQLLSGAHHAHLTCITFKLNNARARACLRLVGVSPLSNAVSDVDVRQGQRGQVGVEFAENCLNIS